MKLTQKKLMYTKILSLSPTHQISIFDKGYNFDTHG